MESLDRLLGVLEALGDGGLGDERRAVLVVVPGPLGAVGLDHHDGDGAVVGLPAGDHEVERGLLDLLVLGVGDPLAVGVEGHAHGTDGALEGQARQHQGGGGSVDGEDVVGVLAVGAHDRGHDLGLVAVAVGEARPQGPVGEAAGENGEVGGSALPPEERAGDAPGGVHALLDVDREGEEVHAFADGLGAVGGDEGLGAADAGQHGALALLGELAGLEDELLVGARDRRGNPCGFGGHWECSCVARSGRSRGPVRWLTGPVPSRRSPERDSGDRRTGSWPDRFCHRL